LTVKAKTETKVENNSPEALPEKKSVALQREPEKK
jgi:hypothetical protein